MLAKVLYIIGLAATLVTIAIMGYQLPMLVQGLLFSMEQPSANLVMALADMLSRLGWALGPLVGGLLVMAAGRIVALLARIEQHLRPDP